MAKKTKILPKEKWRFAVGTTSRVIGTNGTDRHFLILDIDSIEFDTSEIHDFVNSMDCRSFLMPSPRGWHLFTDLIVSFNEFKTYAKELGADSAWIAIGESRGYWFLADYMQVLLPWTVERMMLRWRDAEVKERRRQKG